MTSDLFQRKLWLKCLHDYWTSLSIEEIDGYFFSSQAPRLNLKTKKGCHLFFHDCESISSFLTFEQNHKEIKSLYFLGFRHRRKEILIFFFFQFNQLKGV